MQAIQNKFAKTLITAVTLVAVSSTAMAHDPKLHAQKDQMNCKKIAEHMKMTDKMDHSKMNMNDPAM